QALECTASLLAGRRSAVAVHSPLPHQVPLRLFPGRAQDRLREVAAAVCRRPAAQNDIGGQRPLGGATRLAAAVHSQLPHQVPSRSCGGPFAGALPLRMTLAAGGRLVSLPGWRPPFTPLFPTRFPFGP